MGPLSACGFDRSRFERPIDFLHPSLCATSGAGSPSTHAVGTIGDAAARAAAFAVVRENEPDEPDEPDKPDKPAHACSEHARVLKLLPIEQA